MPVIDCFAGNPIINRTETVAWFGHTFHDNPAKIVSGFGGTFCFVLSLIYIVLVVGAEALPLYAPLVGLALDAESQPWAIAGSWVFVSILSLVATSVPMTLALKRVETLEM